MDEIIDKTIKELFSKIALKAIINNYALENIILDKAKPTEQIDLNNYTKDLKIQYLITQNEFIDISGAIVNNQGKIINKSINEYLLEFYCTKIKHIFDCQVRTTAKNDDDFLPFPSALKEYLVKVFNIFKEICDIKPSYNLHDLASPYYSNYSYADTLNKITKLIIAIKLHKLKQGACIDKYIKDLAVIPISFQRLIKKSNGRFLLANSDTESIDYIVALLICIPFYKYENKRIFEIKAETWRMNKLIKF